MKKNLISIMILALLVVNVVLTAVMMFSVTGAAKKTSLLVNNIATVLNIELTESEAEADTTVSIADSVPFDIPDSLTVPLKKGSDGKDHYCLVSASIHMNSKHDDYESFSPLVASNTSLFKQIIISVIGSYTIDEAKDNQDMMREAILKKIQEEFGSTFIYKVTFSNIMFQ